MGVASRNGDYTIKSLINNRQKLSFGNSDSIVVSKEKSFDRLFSFDELAFGETTH